MNVMIGIDPHKASHTVVAIDHDEDQVASVKVRATAKQVDQLLFWAERLADQEPAGPPLWGTGDRQDHPRTCALLVRGHRRGNAGRGPFGLPCTPGDL